MSELPKEDFYDKRYEAEEHVEDEQYRNDAE